MEKFYAALYAATAEAAVCASDGVITLREGLLIALAFLGAGHVYTATNTSGMAAPE